MLVVNAMLSIAVFVVVGLLSRKLQAVPEDFSLRMNTFIIRMILPIFLFYTMASRDMEALKNLMQITVIAFLSFFALFVISKPLSKIFSSHHNLYEIVLCFPNALFMGIPVVRSFLGDEGVFYLVPFMVIHNLLFWSYGAYLIVKDQKIPLRKHILNPPMAGVALGLIYALTGLGLPDFINDTFNTIGGTVSPLAMMGVGMILAEFSFKEIQWKDFVLISFFRLLAYPLLVFLVLKLLGMTGYSLYIPTLVMAMPGAVNGVMLAQTQGEDARMMSYMVLFTTIVSLLTIPIIGFVLGIGFTS